MPRWMRRTVHGAGLLSLASGLLWLVLHHFMQVPGEFGPEAHPFERPSLVVHGAAAVLAAWVLGLIWMGHVRRGLAIGRKRASGLGLVAVVLFLMASGWGLYYAGEEGLRERLGTAHWVVGIAAALLLLMHARGGRPPVNDGRRGREPGAV